jgi:hypothetical protein
MLQFSFLKCLELDIFNFITFNQFLVYLESSINNTHNISTKNFIKFDFEIFFSDFFIPFKKMNKPVSTLIENDTSLLAFLVLFFEA